MHLKIFVEDPELREEYNRRAADHNAKIATSTFPDSGFDLIAPISYPPQTPNTTFVLDYKIKCAATNNNKPSAFYLYPRSSITKTVFRLANSAGIIDSGYRGNIMAVFDVKTPHTLEISTSVNKYDRLTQICSPTLSPITVEIVNTLNDLSPPTTRGEGGFGSTGK